MDRHRAPAMSGDSICSGVYVDGVCAGSCNRSKVVAALEAVKVTLVDAAGLQCSEVGSDTSQQVFTGLQLDHKTGVLSLEASLHLAAAAWSRKASFGRLSGQVDWAHHLELPAASSSLVSRQCKISLRAHLRASKRAGLARRRPGIPLDCVLIALLTCNLSSPWSPRVYATDASGGARGGHGVARRKCANLCHLSRHVHHPHLQMDCVSR